VQDIVTSTMRTCNGISSKEKSHTYRNNQGLESHIPYPFCSIDKSNRFQEITRLKGFFEEPTVPTTRSSAKEISIFDSFSIKCHYYYILRLLIIAVVFFVYLFFPMPLFSG